MDKYINMVNHLQILYAFLITFFCLITTAKLSSFNNNNHSSNEIPSSPDERFYAMSDARLKQELILAVKIGLGMGDFIFHPASSTEVSDGVDFSFSAGFRFGYFPGLFGLFFDIEWHKKGALTSHGHIHVNTLDLNLLVGIKRDIFYFAAGFYLGFITRVKHVSDGIEIDITDLFNKLEYGFTVSTGILIMQHMKFFAGVEFKLGFTNIVKNAFITSERNYSNINVMIIFGFGI